MSTRRKFIAGTAGAVAAALSESAVASEISTHPHESEIISLCGKWLFRIDPNKTGSRKRWYESAGSDADWKAVTVPHTWQIEPSLAGYRGEAWYRRHFDAPLSWQECAVRVEFEGVFHSATVWINGKLVGEHARKGYTAFTFDIARFLQFGKRNVIFVRVDNAFNRHMLPRGQSSDWANDGGIYRPVHLLVTPKTFVEHVSIDAVPDLSSGSADLKIDAQIRSTSARPWKGKAGFRVIDEATGLTVLENASQQNLSVAPNSVETISCEAVLPNARLWHFDHPNLYRLEVSIFGETGQHSAATNFGVRKFEIKDGAFFLNGENVRLMGVERMAGSNPDFGMAEPSEWIEHDHGDLKNLNCIFTRVHWPQDKRVLDYCDRHGILMQSEIPAWGWETFEGMTSLPDADLVENGVQQLREMIARDRNHPSIVIWGLCNEIAGQNPPAYEFAKRMLEEAKRLDPNRLCSYASNSLGSTPERDVAGLMDVIETNEYYGTWAPGTAEDAGRHLDSVHAAFPGKLIVVSEYGYCACTPDRPEGDEPRIETLRTHTAAYRSKPFVAGAIFFCYNDYRTHVGDRGVGPLQQRVHGVVDVFGNRKPSYEVLREESSPIESLHIERRSNNFQVTIRTRSTLPMYMMHGYKLRAVFFGQGDIPIETQEEDIAETTPGSEMTLELAFQTSESPIHVQFDVLRPTSFSAYTLDWKP